MGRGEEGEEGKRKGEDGRKKEEEGEREEVGAPDPRSEGRNIIKVSGEGREAEEEGKRKVEDGRKKEEEDEKKWLPPTRP